MWRNEQKLYPKLKTFFNKAYLYSKEGCVEDRHQVTEYDEKRYISALQFRYVYNVVEGQVQVSFFHHIRTISYFTEDHVDFQYCEDIFSNRLLDQLRFVEIDVSTLEGFQIVMDFYHNHYVNNLQRKFYSPHEQ